MSAQAKPHTLRTILLEIGGLFKLSRPLSSINSFNDGVLFAEILQQIFPSSPKFKNYPVRKETASPVHLPKSQSLALFQELIDYILIEFSCELNPNGIIDGNLSDISDFFDVLLYIMFSFDPLKFAARINTLSATSREYISRKVSDLFGDTSIITFPATPLGKAPNSTQRSTVKRKLMTNILDSSKPPYTPEMSLYCNFNEEEDRIDPSTFQKLQNENEILKQYVETLECKVKKNERTNEKSTTKENQNKKVNVSVEVIKDATKTLTEIDIFNASEKTRKETLKECEQIFQQKEAEFQKTINLLKEKISSQQTTLTSLNSSNVDSKILIDKKEEEIRLLLDTKDGLEREVSTLHKELELVKKDRKTLEKELNSQAVELEILDSLKRQLSEQFDVHTKLRQSLTTAEGKAERTYTEKCIIETERDEMEKEVHKLKKELMELTSQQIALFSNSETNNSQTNGSRNFYRSLGDEELEEKVEQLEKENLNLRRQVINLQAQNESKAFVEAEFLNTVVKDQLKVELTNAQKEQSQRTQNTISKLKEENNEMKQMLTRTKTELGVLIEELKKTKNQRDESKHRLKQINAKIHQASLASQRETELMATAFVRLARRVPFFKE